MVPPHRTLCVPSPADPRPTSPSLDCAVASSCAHTCSRKAQALREECEAEVCTAAERLEGLLQAVEAARQLAGADEPLRCPCVCKAMPPACPDTCTRSSTADGPTDLVLGAAIRDLDAEYQALVACPEPEGPALHRQHLLRLVRRLHDRLLRDCQGRLDDVGPGSSEGAGVQWLEAARRVQHCENMVWTPVWMRRPGCLPTPRSLQRADAEGGSWAKEGYSIKAGWLPGCCFLFFFFSGILCFEFHFCNFVELIPGILWNLLFGCFDSVRWFLGLFGMKFLDFFKFYFSESLPFFIFLFFHFSKDLWFLECLWTTALITTSYYRGKPGRDSGRQASQRAGPVRAHMPVAGSCPSRLSPPLFSFDRALRRATKGSCDLRRCPTKAGASPSYGAQGRGLGQVQRERAVAVRIGGVGRSLLRALTANPPNGGCGEAGAAK